MRAWLLVAMAAVLAPAAAMAQAPTPNAASSAPQEAPPAPPPSAASSAPAKPVVPATGYGWSTPKAAKGARPRGGARAARPKPNTPDALLPGFEMLPDGSTRLFVELSQPVAYEAKKAPGSLTYVLKGAHAGRRNNYNPLVTVHFNTPVTSARLVPHGKDLWFVIELRADVTPTATMDPAKDGVSTLRIDFPKGAYVSPTTEPAPATGASLPETAPGASAHPASSSSPPGP
jgi:hypothetical protein